MELYETEEQQVKALKNWWKANKNAVISGIVGGVVVIGGWNYWQGYKQDTLLQASSLYEELLIAVNKNETESANKIAERLEANFASTPYADYAKLYEAKLAVKEGDLVAAKNILQSLAAQTNNGLKNVATIRLLQILLANGEYEQGLQLIAEQDQQSTQAFAGNYDELTGDFYAALDRKGEARTAYENALRAGQVSPLLQYKIDDLTAPELLESNS